VLGIMSGTSIDSVDLALCDCLPDQIRLQRHWQTAFPRPLQRRLHAAARNEVTTWELGQLHHDLGRFYAHAAVRSLGSTRPDAVGLHGQTVFHQPRPPASATLQIGEPAWLADALQVPVVSNFRAADLAAGGQGAPLATLFHQVAFARRGEFVCVNNLGGISNVTALDWRRGLTPRVLAFDTGPANVLLDLAARHFSGGHRSCDRHGAWARGGTPHETLLARWLRHPYFRRPPPKSTGREMFGEPFWQDALPTLDAAGLSRDDALATLTEFTARSLALNYRLHLGGTPGRVVLAGGGAANPELVRCITAALRDKQPAVEVISSESLGWPSETLEAAAFALLAAYRLWELPANLPGTTGARRQVLLGQLTRHQPGSARARCKRRSKSAAGVVG
jgi:anhydro-N-acetylmuramic acid kinase